MTDLRLDRGNSGAATVVRPGRDTDAAAMALAQARAWRAAYASMTPDIDFDHRSDDEVAASWTPLWRQALGAAPSPHHHVLVATDHSIVTGFVTVTPPAPPAPAPTAEIGALVVDPDHQRRGHGSRLLSAAMDVVAANPTGVNRVLVWVPALDQPRIDFFTSAGFAPDGARRTYATEVRPVVEVRLVTTLG
jgi:GNAT superfamily N-acetyltransferase